MPEQQSADVSARDHLSIKSSADNSTSNSDATAVIATATFESVLEAVKATSGLTAKVRSNLCSAVYRTATLMGAKGLAATIDIPAIAKRLEPLTAAKLGMTTDGALAAYKSNFRRALKLADVRVMPGKSHQKLSADWQFLADKLRAERRFAWPALSRFVHFASERGWQPDEINCKAFERFGEEVRTACLRSKAEKTVRDTARAWGAAQSIVPDWPRGRFGYEPTRKAAKTRAWSDFPAGFYAEAQQFVQAGSTDWLDDADRLPIKQATRLNYLWAIRRAASVVVANGTPIEQLDSLTQLVTPTNAKLVVRKVYEDTRRQRGGTTQIVAWIMYRIASVHLGIKNPELKTFVHLVKETRPAERRMGDRTLARFRPFADCELLDRFFQMPERLMLEASRRPVGLRSAKLVRLALYLAILQETAARSKNVVSLNVESQILVEGQGKAERLFVCIAGAEVKNGAEIRTMLSKTTAAIYRKYVASYRRVHRQTDTSWLFPRADGSHWTVTQACADLKDASARLLGTDVTPHLTRSLAGKVFLNARPDAYASVQRVLGHKSLTTTIAHYTHLDTEKARRDYQEVIEVIKTRGAR